MNEVLAEIPRVREDLGYPPLVTPTSQIVGTQALLNVLSETRYKSITNEVKLYMQGRYGKPPAEVNASVRQQAIGNEEVITCRPADLLEPEMEKLTREIGQTAETDEDVLTYAMFPEVGRNFLEQRAAGTLEPEALEPQRGDSEDYCVAATEFNVAMHGETFHIKVTGTGHKTQDKRAFYINVDGLPEEVIIESLDEVITNGATEGTPSSSGSKKSSRPKATLPGHVTTSMPGTIVDVLVSVGDKVAAGDPVLVTEAMKMETEIQAPIAGTVVNIHVKKGESVNPDESLIEIE
jgi:pyruvate carboxylase subunit B